MECKRMTDVNEYFFFNSKDEDIWINRKRKWTHQRN